MNYILGVCFIVVTTINRYIENWIDRRRTGVNLGVNNEAMDNYIISFNFFLYSQKNKKFYTSIIETDNACCYGALTENEKALFNDLYTTYHFDDLIRRSLDFVKSKSSLFEKYDNDLAFKIGNYDKDRLL